MVSNNICRCDPDDSKEMKVCAYLPKGIHMNGAISDNSDAVHLCQNVSNTVLLYDNSRY